MGVCVNAMEGKVSNFNTRAFVSISGDFWTKAMTLVQSKQTQGR
jgi:hypothetical protein